MQLRKPIVMPKDRKLRVIFYARFSTEEQDASSITDQFAFCRRFLEQAGVNDAQIDEYDDQEMSGELASRPGIDQMRQRLARGECDLFIAEDSGRAYRNHTQCFELVETAVDEDVRVIFPNDFVDTAEEGWEARLNEAQRHHVESNRFTRLRIARKMRGLWEGGYAIGKVRTGYRRRLVNPLMEAKSPKVDEINPDYSQFVFDAYKMIANGDPTWFVAKFLKDSRVPKCGKSAGHNWDEGDVIALIRRTIHRGLDQYRVTITKKKRRSGKRSAVRNSPEEIWQRDIEHLRIVPDWLWYKANQAIDDRTTRRTSKPTGKHPLAGLPRDSRGPLTNVLFCACGGKMHHDRNHRYCCSRAKKGECWIKATADQELTLERISSAIIDEILKLEGVVDGLVKFCQELRDNPQPVREEISRLQSQAMELSRMCQRLAAAIEASDDPPEAVLALIKPRQRELIKVKSRIQELEAQAALPKEALTRAAIERNIARVAYQVMDMDREAAVAIERLLVGPIRAIPYLQFGTQKVLLRAEFTIQLAAIVPDQLLRAMRENGYVPDSQLLAPIDLVVDLFDTLPVPKHAQRAFGLTKTMTLEEIGRELGESKRNAHRAAQLGKLMHEMNLRDPFIRLTKPPENLPARWRYNRSAPPNENWIDGSDEQNPAA